MLCWGYNGYGHVGDGSTVNRTSPTLVVGNVKQMALGEITTYALRNNGTVYSWGYNAHGQIGNGTTTNQSGPTLIASLTAIDTIITTTYRYGTAFAIKNSGNTVYSWGYAGDYGQTGNGTLASILFPSIINLKNVKAMTSCGSWDNISGSGWQATNMIVLLKDGGVKCWGYGGAGGNGNANNIGTYTPQLINR